MNYYEIEFYGVGHEYDFTFYVKSEKELSLRKMKRKLNREFLGVDGLEKHHLKNIVSMNDLTGEEFTGYCGIEA